MTSYAQGKAVMALLVAVALVGPSICLDNGLGLTPPMGYNTWNDMKEAINEGAVKERADAMVKLGFVEAGYTYLNLDDGWALKERDPATGAMVPDPKAFPSGMKALGDYIHARGLKFGIYSDRGTLTCAKRAGSLGHEKQDALLFASWGVDYLKEDNCNAPGGANNQKNALLEFSAMRDALNATGRPIFFSVCGGGDNLPFVSDITWYAKPPFGRDLANSWRIAGDVGAPLGLSWGTALAAMAFNSGLSEYSGPGGWNDPDMLLTSHPRVYRSLQPYQSRTMFAVWCVMAAPLLIGGPVHDLSDYDRETYLNKELIAVDQDPLGRQGFPLQHTAARTYPVWARHLSGGRVAMVLANQQPWAASVRCDAACWKAAGIADGTRFTVRDLWAHGPYAAQPEVTVPEALVARVDGWGHSVAVLLAPVAAELEPII